MADDIDASRLAEGLSGVVALQKPLSETTMAIRASATRSGPTASVSPLLINLEQLVDDVLEATSHEKVQNIEPQATKIKGLTFAISSSVGFFWSLDTKDEDVLWHLATKLWNASLRVFQSSEDENPTADLLLSLGSDIFQVINGESPAVQHVSQYIEFLCKMGREWDRLGNQNRSSWFVSHAVVYAKRLEALMSAEELPAHTREQCIFQLFNLYLQAARESNKSMQQSLANNMLAKALYLSKQQEILLPQTVAEMALGLAELQIEQAHSLLSSQGDAAALVLFTAAERHVDDALHTVVELENSTTRFDYQELKIKAEQMQVHVLVATAQAHLAAGEPALASKKLESLKTTFTATSNIHPFTTIQEWFCTVGCCVVHVHLALGEIQAAAQILSESAHRSTSLSASAPSLEINAASKHLQTPISQHANNMARSWMECFEKVLQASPQDGTGIKESRLALVGAVADAALAYIHSAANVKEWQHVEAVLQCLLGSEGKEDISLKVLATNEVIAMVVANSKLQGACYSMLLTSASQHFLAGSNQTCASLLAAALQYAPRICKARTAELLAATHLKLGNSNRALEYLEIARAHRAGDVITSMSALVEMGAAFASENVAQSQQALQHLRQSPDFHIESAQAAIQVSQLSVDLSNAADVAAMAVQSLIPQDNTPSHIPPGQECTLLSSWVHALLSHVVNLKNKIKLQGNPSTENLQNALMKTMDNLVIALKLSTKRLKIIGIDKFVGNNGKDGGGGDSTTTDSDAINKLELLAHHGYRACVEALELGLYNQCVTLSSSTCVLLEDLIPYRGQNTHAVQSNVLMLAVQSLISDLRFPTPNQDTISAAKKAFRLHLAGKLLNKVREKVNLAGPSARQVLTPAVLILYLEIASLQGNQADMLTHLQALSLVDTPLTKTQVSSIVQATLTAPPKIKEAACTALVNLNAKSSTGGGASFCMEEMAALLGLAQGSKQKLEVIQAAAQLRLANVTPVNGTFNGPFNGTTATIGDLNGKEQQDNKKQQQEEQQEEQRLRLEHQCLAAEAYNTGVSFATSDPRNAIPFFRVARDLDKNLRQLCDEALEILTRAAAKQPPSPPLSEAPKKLKNKNPPSLSHPPPLPPPPPRPLLQPFTKPLLDLVLNRLGSAEKENDLIKPEQTTNQEDHDTAVEDDKVNLKDSIAASKMKTKQQSMHQGNMEVEDLKEVTPVIAVSPPPLSGGSPSSRSPKVLVSPPKVISDSGRTTPPSSVPKLLKKKKTPSSLLVPSVRKDYDGDNDDTNGKQRLAKRQKKEARAPAAAAAVVPASRPFVRVAGTQQKVQQQQQQNQSSSWLSSVLSAQRNSFKNAFQKGGGSGSSPPSSGAALPPVKKHQAPSFIPPRPKTKAAGDARLNVSASVPVQDTADALSLDSGDN